ncbi:MAG: U32 family peptidase [Planctomycetota bacterium]|nr:U32 family peptidase [Planctomycetota bacterium]
MDAAEPEILAPAGGRAAFEAALTAGADAVYLGLGELDARRGAEGFSVAELPELVARAHEAGARVHLTLNIVLATRELGRAARTLAWAESSGIDAVLVCDPALLALCSAYPRLSFHWSTQAGVSSSAGVRAARALGVQRVVLARELSLAEIAACTGLGVETEVFVQGALCFAVSGRCSMTSWVGGRSGNRGTCTSICRVGWSCNGGALARPLDMKDLSAVRVATQLRALGVSSWKIEGRLKTAPWVQEAVRLWRRARAGEADPAQLWQEAQRLGAYAGREMTDAYLTGARVGLVHPDDGRAPGLGAAVGDQDPPRVLDLRCHPEDRGLRWLAHCAGRELSFVTQRPQAHPGRALDWAALCARLRAALPEGAVLGACLDETGGLRLPRRTVNEVVARLAAWLRPRADGIDRLQVVIPEAARRILAPPAPHPDNRLDLRCSPTRLRCDLAALPALAPATGDLPIAVEVRERAAVLRAHQLLGARLIAALPPVLYEHELPDAAAVCAYCAQHGIALEANGWDGWMLAQDAGCRELHGGPGLAVLNPLAAQALAAQGCRSVHALPEADDHQLADLCAACAVPLIITVFGRPPLMYTRAWSQAPPWTMRDARGSIEIAPRQEGAVIALRPCQPYDWRGLAYPGIRAAALEMDLCASPDPLREWRQPRRPDAARFNLGRTLV